MSDTIISIIIPVYNVEEYIVECLESVAAQTYQEGVECIIVDDCGTDGSMTLAQSFVDGHRGNILYRIVRHNRNMGLSAARNTGIKSARGKYIVFFDSDDTITSDCLSRFMEVASKYPDAEMIAAGLKDDRKRREKSYSMEKAFPDYADNPAWISRMVLMRGGWKGIPVTSVNRLIRRDFILKHQLFFREGILHEDELWNFMLAPALSRIAFYKHNTYLRRVRPHSITTSFKSKDDDALSCLPVWHEILSLFTPELEKEQTYSLWQFINDISPTCRDSIVRKEVRGILWQLVKKGAWPYSPLIFLYLQPFIFYIKFIRKLIAKAASINVEPYNCCMS